MKTCRVQQYHKTLGWRNVPFTQSQSRKYCDGWLDCMDSMYPSPPMRIVAIDSKRPAQEEVVRETKGHGPVHTN